MNFWFVNLGKYYKEQREGNFLWAPLHDKSGKKLYHWENMALVKKNDVIFCNNKGYIVAIAIAKDVAYIEDIPQSFKNDWCKEGRKLDIEFHDLDDPLKYSLYKDYISKNIDLKQNPFDKNCDAKQGYLLPLDAKIAQYFLKKANETETHNIVNSLQEDEEFIKEQEQEEQEQIEKINAGTYKRYTEKELEILEQKKYDYQKEIEKTKEKNKEKDNNNPRAKTDPRLKATRLDIANFKCEVDKNHHTFTNKIGKQYMECHHLIPMNAQKDFNNLKLDQLFNLIAICPICHSQAHYANKEEQKEIITKMYNKRKDEMENKGITLELFYEIVKKYY